MQAWNNADLLSLRIEYSIIIDIKLLEKFRFVIFITKITNSFQIIFESLGGYGIEKAIHQQALIGVLLRKHRAVFPGHVRRAYVREGEKQCDSRFLHRERFFDSLQQIIEAFSVFGADTHALHSAEFFRKRLVDLIEYRDDGFAARPEFIKQLVRKCQMVAEDGG